MEQPQAEDGDEFPKPNQDELQQMRQQMLGAAYKQTTLQLLIFQRGQRRNATIYHTKPLLKQPINRRCSFGIRKPSATRAQEDQQLEKNMPSAKVLNEIQLDKLLDMLRNVFTVAYEELNNNDRDDDNAHSDDNEHITDDAARATSTTHTRLHSTIEAQKGDNDKLEKLTHELQQNETTLKSLKQQFETERQTAEERMKCQDERLATLRHNLRNITLLNALELRLVQKWEENRYVQATILSDKEQGILAQQIVELHRRLAGEQLLISEVDNFSEKQFNEFRAQIASWQHKYSQEMKKMEMKTQEKQQCIASVQDALERHRQTEEEHKQFVHDYLAEKAEEQRLYEQQMYRVECAVRLQAWWRGVMVRHGFGPYKKKSKKGKKSKAKGK